MSAARVAERAAARDAAALAVFPGLRPFALPALDAAGRDELAGCVEGWQREGAQTWEDRKRRRIERSRPFGYTSGAHG